MKPIEELRAAHAATTQGEWGYEIDIPEKLK